MLATIEESKRVLWRAVVPRIRPADFCDISASCSVKVWSDAASAMAILGLFRCGYPGWGSRLVNFVLNPSCGIKLQSPRLTLYLGADFRT